MELKVSGGNFRIRKKADVTQRILKAVNNQWRLAVRAGLEAIIKSDAIKVQTGMAASSWVPIARAVRHLDIWKSTHRPKIGPRTGYTDMSGQWNFFGRIKGPAAGEAAGEEASFYKKGTRSDPTWAVEFKINVYHYLLHEAGLVKGSGPWDSLQIFSDAVVAYIQNLIDKDQFLPANRRDLFIFGRK